MARGNFEVGASWDEGSLTEMTVLSNNGNEFKIRYNEIADSTVKDSAGNEIEFTVIDDNTISFATVEGETYTITPDQAVQSTYQVLRRQRGGGGSDCKRGSVLRSVRI